MEKKMLIIGLTQLDNYLVRLTGSKLCITQKLFLRTIQWFHLVSYNDVAHFNKLSDYWSDVPTLM